MSDEMLWSRLHDAFLEKIEIDFRHGIIAICIRLPTEAEAAQLPLAGAHPAPLPRPGPVQIECEGFRRFICPREQPWGPSMYINNASTTSGTAGLTVLRIEIQSGDEIEIHATKMIISRKE